MTSLLNTAEPEANVPAAQTAPGHSARRWRFMIPLLLVLGFVAHVAWRLWLQQYVPTVVAHADEDRYLLSARALAGGPGGFGNDTEAFRRLGYPLLLTPIYSYTQDPFKVYHAAQALGAVLNALTFPLAYLFARRVLGQARWLALGMAFVGVALPAVVYYSQFTLTDVLFAPIGLAWLLLLHGWIAGRTNTGRLLAALGAGAVVGYAYVTHVRGIVLLAVHLGVVLLVLIAKRGRVMWAVGSALAALLVTRVDWLAKQALGDSVEHGGIEPDNKMLSAFTTALGFVRMVCDAAGQLWYLAIATGGLGAVGLVVAYHAMRNPHGFVKRTMAGVVLVSTVLIALASAAALPIDTRVSNHAYFRYIAFLAPVWIMIAISALVAADMRERRKLILRAAALVGVTLFVLLARMAPGEWFHPFDTPEVSFLTGSWDAFRPFKASVIAMALLAIWLVRQWLVPLSALLAVSLATMVAVNVKSIRPMVEQEYLPGSRLVHDIGITRADVVQHAEQMDMGSSLNHQREITWEMPAPFDALKEMPAAETTVVIAPWYPENADKVCREDDEEDESECRDVHWDGTRYGWARIYTYDNDDRHWAAWRK